MSLPVFYKLSKADVARAIQTEPTPAGPPQGGAGFINMPKPVHRSGSAAFTCDRCHRDDRMTESAGHDLKFCHACLIEQETHRAGLERMVTR